MFKKLTLSATLMIVLTSLGCVCSPGGNILGIGGYNPCGPCVPSYECTPCGMSACDPVVPCGPCEPAPCEACEPVPCGPCEPAPCGPCEQATYGCNVPTCESACSYGVCNNASGFGVGIGFGSENGLFSYGAIKHGHGFPRRAPEEMYVTRGPRDFFYDPNTVRR